MAMTEENLFHDPIRALSEKLDKDFKPRVQCPCGTLLYGHTDAEAQRTYYFHLEFFHVDIRPEDRKRIQELYR